MKLIKLLAGLILLMVILFLLSKFYLPHFLSYQKPVESDNFLIEAWISSYEIEQAVADYRKQPESHFYIVGFLYPKLDVEKTIPNLSYVTPDKKDNNGIWLFANSSLDFLLPPKLSLIASDTIQIIVTAKGHKSANYFAYFSLVINGECIDGAFSQEEYYQYTFDWVVPEEGLKTCYIKFNNDLVVNNSDRNLNIKSIEIDNKLLFADTTNTKIVRDLNNLTSGFASQADEVGNYLQKLGVDHNQITIVSFEPVPSNQTLAAAAKFNDYIAEYSLPLLNVITYDMHSRRTWLTYQKILGKKTNVGVLYYPSSKKDKGKKKENSPEIFYIINEFLAYLANWFLLTF